MKAIKFKGKRRDNGEWVYGDLIHGVSSKSGKMYILPTKHIYPKGCSEIDGWDIVPETVGQFTGAIDEYGKEIYEGDIIKNMHGNGVIKWDNNDLCYEVEYNAFHKDWLCAVMPSIEIIGNIHDNPGLLNTTEPE